MCTTKTYGVTSARKKHTCTWCWEWIEVGEPYEWYFCFESMRKVKMHPECMIAMHKWDGPDADLGELPVSGTYRRGKWGED